MPCFANLPRTDCNRIVLFAHTGGYRRSVEPGRHRIVDNVEVIGDAEHSGLHVEINEKLRVIGATRRNE